jgi:hypothetical protein
MSLNMFHSLKEGVSHPILAGSACRQDCATHRCDLMRMRVIIAVELVVDNVVDTRG